MPGVFLRVNIMNTAALKYFTQPKTFDKFPISWNEVFGNKNKLVVEIGFGNGEFMAHSAMKDTQFNYIGFDTSITSCYKAQVKLFDLGIENARIILDDARFCIRELFSQESIHKLVVNFPCPWPKAKQEDRRIFIYSFIDTMANVLKINGTVELVTDVQWYAEQVYEKFLSDECFYVDEIKTDFQREIKTRYEEKWEKMGRNKYMVLAHKKASRPVKRILEGSEDMPHKLVEKIDLSKANNLLDKKFSCEEQTFIVKEFFYNHENNRYIFRVFSADGDYCQQYYVKAVKREDKYLVKLDSTTIPFRTPAVKWSVLTIADEISK